MATLEIEVDDSGFKKLVRNYPDQVNFVTSRAINKTALQIQKAARANLRKKFEIRRPTYADRSVKISQFAKKRFLEAIIEVTSPGETKDTFAKFEAGGIKRARENRRVAIPQDVQKTRRGIISARKRPEQLIRSGKGFIITSKRGQDLLLVAKGRGRRRRNIVAYSLEHQVRIPADLGFFKLSDGIVNRNWQTNFAIEFFNAIRTAR